jgi:hypothetical protein
MRRCSAIVLLGLPPLAAPAASTLTSAPAVSSPRQASVAVMSVPPSPTRALRFPVVPWT